MKTKKLVCLIMIIALMLPIVAGCTSSNAPSENESTPGNEVADDTIYGLPRSETFVLGVTAPVRTLNPFMGTERMTSSIISHTVNDVLAWRYTDGTVVPRMAESWEMIDDVTWEFKLRDNIYSHDGQKLTAEDVKFTFEKAMSKTEYAQYQLPKQVGLKEVIVLDELTFQLKTEEPTNVMEYWLFEAQILPRHYYEDKSDEDMAVEAVGFGPYKVREYVLNDRLILEANENYWNGEPAIKYVVIRTIPEEGARINELRAGNIDYCDQISLDVADQLNTDVSHVDAQEGLRKMALTISIEKGHEALKDKRVRQALNYAINKEAICENILSGFTKPYSSYVNPNNNNPDLKPYPYDPEKAKQLLADAGYADGLELTLVSPTNRYGLDKEITTQMAADLGEVGIKVKNEYMELGVFLERLEARELKDLVWIGWAALTNPTIENLILTTGHVDNSATWSNAEFDKLYKELAATLDSDKAQEINFKMQEIAWEEAPWVFLWRLPQVGGLNNRIEWDIRNDGYIHVFDAKFK